MRRFICAAAVACAAGTSRAGYVVSGKTITFTVAAGAVETNDTAMTSAYDTFVKDGLGTLVMTKDVDSVNPFKGKIEVKAGILQLDTKNPFGGYNNVYITSGAQWYTHYGMGAAYTDYSTICQYFKSIAGTGPDGKGAIRINNTDNAKWNNWRSCFRNEVTLGSDATIYVDTETIIGFNAGSKLNLNGHTLTMAGAGRLYFGNEVNAANPVVTAGNIVNDMTGNTLWIKKGVTFEGSSANTLTLGASVAYIYLDSVTVPIAWKLVLGRTADTEIRITGNLRNGAFDETVNDFAGGMDLSGYVRLVADNTPTAAHPRAVTFSGKVAPVSAGYSAGISCYINIKNNNYLTVHLKHANDCKCVFYTGTGIAYVDNAFGSESISLASNDSNFGAKPGTARVLLGEGKCTGAYAATLPGIVEAWRTEGTGAGALEFYSDEDVTVPGPLTMKTTAVTLAHGGTGKITVSGNVNACPIELRGAGIFEFDAGTMGAARVTSVVSGRPDVLALGGTVTSSTVLKGAYETGSTAAFHQYGGTYTPPNGTRLTSIYGTGFYGMTNGTLNFNNDEGTIGSTSAYTGDPAVLASGKAVFQMDGGTIVQNGNRMRMSYGGEMDFLMRGGTYAIQADKGLYFAGDSSSNTAAVEQLVFSMVGNDPVFDASASGAWISMSSRPNNQYEVFFNLNAGVLKASSLGLTHNYLKSPVYFNLNGGAIAWSDRDYVWAAAQVPREMRIYEKGFTFEANYASDTTDRMFLVDSRLSGATTLALKPLSGRGVAKILLPENMPRTGYSAIAPVRIVTAPHDTGWGATASLDFDIAKGTVADALLITCPGNDYTNVPTVVAYGPDLTTPYECTVTLTEAGRTPGAFVKTGPGELVLNLGHNNDRLTSPHNAYPGPYVISNGCLMVNYWSNIPTNSKVFVAGGCFRWDWTSRTIAEFGGWGTFFGSLNNATDPLTVTTRFNVDAKDLVAGRSLLQSTQTSVNEKSVEQSAVGDNVVFGPNCKVRIAHPEALDGNTLDYLILRQTSIARLPELEEPLTDWYLMLRRGGRELHLRKLVGTILYVR